MQHVEHPVGQAGFLPQLGQPVGGRGVLLARLEDDGVAGRDRDREEPHRHHRREVERRDDPDDAQRLPDRGHVDLGGGVLGHAALEQVRQAAGQLDDLLAAGDLAERVGEHLAVFAGDDLGGLVLAFVEQFPEPEQHLGAAGQGHVPPPRERGGGGGDHRLRVGPGGQRDLLGDPAGGRVVHRRRCGPTSPANGAPSFQCGSTPPLLRG